MSVHDSLQSYSHFGSVFPFPHLLLLFLRCVRVLHSAVDSAELDQPQCRAGGKRCLMITIYPCSLLFLSTWSTSCCITPSHNAQLDLFHTVLLFVLLVDVGHLVDKEGVVLLYVCHGGIVCLHDLDRFPHDHRVVGRLSSNKCWNKTKISANMSSVRWWC